MRRIVRVSCYLLPLAGVFVRCFVLFWSVQQGADGDRRMAEPGRQDFFLFSRLSLVHLAIGSVLNSVMFLCAVLLIIVSRLL